MTLAVAIEMKPAPGKEAELEKVWMTNILRVCPAEYRFLKSEGHPTTYMQTSYWKTKEQQDVFARSVGLMDQVQPLVAEPPKMTWYEVFFAREATP